MKYAGTSIVYCLWATFLDIQSGMGFSIESGSTPLKPIGYRESFSRFDRDVGLSMKPLQDTPTNSQGNKYTELRFKNLVHDDEETVEQTTAWVDKWVEENFFYFSGKNGRDILSDGKNLREVRSCFSY